MHFILCSVASSCIVEYVLKYYSVIKQNLVHFLDVTWMPFLSPTTDGTAAPI